MCIRDSLYVGERVAEDLRSFKEGGTGSQSHSQYQPNSYPDRLEAGTINLPGVLALGGGFDYIQRVGRRHIKEHLDALTRCFLVGALDLPHVTVYGPGPGEERTPVVMVNVDNMDGGEVAMLLDERYGIAVRSGFHCSPLAHNLMGTGETGGVRFSFSSFNTQEEIDQALLALKEIAQEAAEA